MILIHNPTNPLKKMFLAVAFIAMLVLTSCKVQISAEGLPRVHATDHPKPEPKPTLTEKPGPSSKVLEDLQNHTRVTDLSVMGKTVIATIEIDSAGKDIRRYLLSK